MPSRKDEETQQDTSAEEKPSAILTCLKFLCCPIILIFMSIKIYFCGCLWNKCTDCGNWTKKVLCCGKFVDSEFPPTNLSLGRDHGNNVEWKPAEEVVVDMYFKTAQEQGKKLDKVSIQAGFIVGKIEPCDLAGQGDLGNCWLVSALAAIAEHPGALFRCMRTTQLNPYGRYHFRFFDFNEDTNDWVDVFVDTLIPTKNGQTIFGAPNQNEMWAVLIEKAFAKFCGSYESLDGGSTAWALSAMMGSPSYVFIREADGTFKRWGSHWEGTKKNRRESCLKRNQKYGAPPPYSREEMWSILVDADERKSIMCCSVTEGNNDTEKTSNGLVCRHAYTLMTAVEVEGRRFVRVRNPWGNAEDGEWTGKWSDKDHATWNAHPSIKKALLDGGLFGSNKTELKDDDGAFWIEYADFAANFGNVTICPRNTGVDDLIIPIDESDVCPQCCGCLRGCGQFWCCCRGCNALCCSTKAKI